VKVIPLAKALNMSRTSFYWHFEDRNAPLGALIERWKQQNTGNLVAQTQLYAETITEAVLTCLTAGLTQNCLMREWILQSATGPISNPN
jgi:AcrR family transcriptional regulator